MAGIAKDLFEKGLDSFKKLNFEEALKFLSESLSLEKNDKAEFLIKKIKNNIDNKKIEKDNENLKNLDQDCQDILNKNNYYDIIFELIIHPTDDYNQVLNDIKNDNLTINPNNWKNFSEKLRIIRFNDFVYLQSQ